MGLTEDHRAHMAYEIERQNREWKATNRRERRKLELVKSTVIALLTGTIVILLIWRVHK